MLHQRLLPVVVLKDSAWALPLADALLEGGLNVIEITLRTEAALAGIATLRRERPELHIGAGTVLDPDVVPKLADLGVEFVVAPGINPATAEAAKRAGLTYYPGVATPTDVETARALGCSTLKFFPAEPLGGATMLKALAAPYNHAGVRWIPTGGIHLEKAKSYADLDFVEAIGGSWFVSADLMERGAWGEIRAKTEEGVAAMVQERPQPT